jgi:hypothetical protein
MQVCMIDGLPCLPPDVHSKVEATGMALGFEFAQKSTSELRHRFQLVGAEREEVRLVSPRQDEHVARAEGGGIGDGHGSAPVEPNVAVRDQLAERAGHGEGPMRSTRRRALPIGVPLTLDELALAGLRSACDRLPFGLPGAEAVVESTETAVPHLARAGQ